MDKHTKELISKGRYGDTILAHISPPEALLLKFAGGSGTINPDTGLPEFFLGGLLKGAGKVVSAPFKWGGDIAEKVGLPNWLGRVGVGAGLGYLAWPYLGAGSTGVEAAGAGTAGTAGAGAAGGYFGSSYPPLALSSSLAPAGAASEASTLLAPAWGGTAAATPSFLTAGAPAGAAGASAAASTGTGGSWLPKLGLGGETGESWLSNMSGLEKTALGLGAAGMGSSYLTGKSNERIAGANREALSAAIEKESWNPESRAKYSNAIESTINKAIEAQRKRAASAASDTGRGGGFFGNEMERATQAGNEFRATEMAKTFAPQPELIQYLAQAGGASPSASDAMVAGIGQTSGNILPYLLAMQYMKS